MSVNIAAINLQWPVGDLEREMLEQLGATIHDHRCRNEAEVISVALEADAIMSVFAPLSGAVLTQLRRCRMISAYSVGTDHIDIAAASRLGIAAQQPPPGSTAHPRTTNAPGLPACTRLTCAH